MSHLHKVLTEIKAVIDLGVRRYRWMSDADYEKELKAYASELVDFLRDHRSRDRYSIDIEPTYEEQCIYCGHACESDPTTGTPYCCEQARAHWEADQYAALCNGWHAWKESHDVTS